MKKITVLVVLFLISGNMINSYAQKDRTLSKGFSINLIIGLPVGNYGWLQGSEVNKKAKFGSLVGFQIGNRWYFGPLENFRMGLMVNWLDLSVAAKNITIGDNSETHAVADVSVFEFGPIGTLALSDKIALDAYYNLRPTSVAHAYMYSNSAYTDNEEVESFSGLGISHTFGTAFRWKVLNAGFEFVIGSIKIKDSTSDYSDYMLDEKLIINNIRLMVGVKF